MNRTRRVIVVLVALVGLVGSACASDGPSGPVESASVALVDEFETLDGSTIDLASLQGEDVVLWFWAPW